MHFRIIEKSECSGISVHLVHYSLRSKSRIYQKNCKMFLFWCYKSPSLPPHPQQKKTTQKMCSVFFLILWFLSSYLQFWSDSNQILPSYSAKATCQSEKGDVVWRFGSEQMLCRGKTWTVWQDEFLKEGGGENRGEIIIHQHVSLCQVHPKVNF